MRTATLCLCVLAPFLLVGCAQEILRLREENKALETEVSALEAEIAALRNQGDGPAPELARIRSFTVGLAASQRDFQETAFVELLTHSLKSGAQKRGYEVFPETDEREVVKIRGMLLHQYLASEEIPISVSNLSFPMRSPDGVFRLGGRVIPAEGGRISPAGSGRVRVEHNGPFAVTMRRDSSGSYLIEHEELGGGRGKIQIPITDVEILDPEQGPMSARQGDISFNWKLNLEQLQVYRVENFQGDVGQFLLTMRYPGISTSISQYQTLRDYVFLFGYGNYLTGLVSQIQTPPYITEVEILPITQDEFEELRGGMSEREILGVVGRNAQWVPCSFVEFSGNQKVWERPPTVGFPFLSRQYQAEKNLLFYNKYDTNGQILIGDFERVD